MTSTSPFSVLLVRADDDPDNVATCARPLPNLPGAPLFNSSSITFHTLAVLIAAGSLGLTVLITIFGSWRHLRTYTAPQEQRQILRIINVAVFYAIFQFLALTFYLDYFYISPISKIYEAFAVAALFFLIIEYVCPDGTDREKYFDALPLLDKKKNVLPGGSLAWYNSTYGTVLQYPIFKLIIVVIEIITQYFGVYCENSLSPKHAKLWLTLFDIIFIGGAFGETLRFAGRLRGEIPREHRSRPKIFSFMGILIFQLLQDLVFGLMNGKVFHPSAKMTYNDINFVVPALMTCVESTIFSLIFLWSYSPGEYKSDRREDRYGTGPATRMSTFRAILNALNLSDIIAGTLTALVTLPSRLAATINKRLSGRRRGQSNIGGGGGGGGRRSRRAGRQLDPRAAMEPLSDQTRLRGYSGGSDFEPEYSPPLQQESDAYGGGYALSTPSMPRAARDPSPGRTQTFRADGLRPAAYAGVPQDEVPFSRSREPSPSGMAAQQPRSMM